jgi:hypothetical protein
LQLEEFYEAYPEVGGVINIEPLRVNKEAVRGQINKQRQFDVAMQALHPLHFIDNAADP